MERECHVPQGIQVLIIRHDEDSSIEVRTGRGNDSVLQGFGGVVSDETIPVVPEWNPSAALIQRDTVLLGKVRVKATEWLGPNVERHDEQLAAASQQASRLTDEARVFLSLEVLEVLLRTRFESPAQMARNEPGKTALAGVEALCRMIRRSFLQRELKSYRVMQQALAPQG